MQHAGRTGRSVVAAAVAAVVLGLAAGPVAAAAGRVVDGHAVDGQAVDGQAVDGQAVDGGGSSPARDDVVLHIEIGPSPFTPPGPEVTVFGDGRVVIERAEDGPARLELTISERAVARLLDEARRAGALRAFDYGFPQITDQAMTTIEVDDGSKRRRHQIYALVFGGAAFIPEGGLGLSDEQLEARDRLARFVLMATDLDTYERRERIEHPTGADEVIFATTTARNGWGAEYPDAVSVTILGDRRVVYGDGSEERWTERQLQRFLREARRIGLLGDAEYGEAMVTDQGTTMVVIDAGGTQRVLAIYALELPEADRGLTEEQAENRQALRELLHTRFGVS